MFDRDFDAAIHLIGELRQVKPDIYINLTTCTYPSPFWLLYADSIWRGGMDSSFAGVGTYRERWITYRDAATYKDVVQRGPLYPLNSLMLHWLIYAQRRENLNTDPGNDFRNEIRSYFGTGTQLQEMYITPSLLTSANWDDLAEAAKWSHRNADVLKDTHWRFHQQHLYAQMVKHHLQALMAKQCLDFATKNPVFMIMEEHTHKRPYSLCGVSSIDAKCSRLMPNLKKCVWQD